MTSNKPGAQRRILITGSSGLIGTALRPALADLGYDMVGLDLRGHDLDQGDVRNVDNVHRAITDCIGVIHLAAVSRVIDGERDPDACWHTNVEGTRNILTAAESSPNQPWVVYASSREVYGQPKQLPADEDAPRAPVNIYGRSKIAAEDLCNASSLTTAIVRFSNVYGSTSDHADRVVPAFARQAVDARTLRVDGRDHTFDFTHLDDTVRGVVSLVERLEAGKELPPIHFVTGQPTTLGQLAALAIELAGSTSGIVEAPPRDFDVSGFYGDPDRARSLLDWEPRVPLREGLERLITDFRAEIPTEVAS